MIVIDEALAYAGRWPVFPCAAGKKPLVEDWGNAASRSHRRIKEWWARWPGALIGVPTGRRSGLVVLDIDVKNGNSGFDTLAGLGLAGLPETPMSHTPSGGLHVYFGCHPQAEIRNSVGEKGIGRGVDIRGEGGLVILPSANGGYAWDPHWNPSTVAFHPAPFWLGHHNKPPAWRGSGPFDPKVALRKACERIRCATDGHKHKTLNDEAFRIGTLVSAGLLRESEAWNDLEAATAVLIATSDAEQKRTRNSLDIAFRDGLKAPRRAGR